jgi:two-component system response regulator YesN
MRPLEYINHLKTERAKDLLSEKRRIPISEIAKRLGYASAAYFSKTFKDKVGLTPEEYRKRQI